MEFNLKLLREEITVQDCQRYCGMISQRFSLTAPLYWRHIFLASPIYTAVDNVESRLGRAVVEIYAMNDATLR